MSAPRFASKPSPRGWVARTRRVWAGAVLATLVAALTLITPAPGQAPAQAQAAPVVTAVGPCPFATQGAPTPEPYRSGLDSLMMPAAPQVARAQANSGQAGGWVGADTVAYGDTPVTAYEMYGMSGLTWSRFAPEPGWTSQIADWMPWDQEDSDAACWDIGASIGNQISNLAFTGTKAFLGVSLSVYQWAADPMLLNHLLTPVDCLLQGCNGSTGLKDALYLNFLTPIIVLGALWAGYQGLGKKRTTEAVQGMIWMVGSAAAALIFMAHPAAIATGANTLVSTVTSAALTGVTGATSNLIDETDICYLPADAKDAGPRMATCSLWQALAFTPWAAGQFGVGPGGDLPTAGDPVKIGNNTFEDIRVAHLEAQSLNHDEMISGDYDTVVAADQKRWDGIAKAMQDVPSGAVWNGEQPGATMGIATVAGIGAISGGTMMLVVSIYSVVWGVAMIFLVLLAPIFLLVGAHPGFGRRTAIKWAELLLGSVQKRLMIGAFLAVLVAVLQTIVASPIPWLAQVMFIVVTGVAALVLRGPLMNVMNISLPGAGQTGLENSDRLTAQGKKGAAVGIGAIAGGAAALSGGGGFSGLLSGAARGGMSASRTGSPLRAASMGTGAGNRVAGKAAAVKDKLAQEAKASAAAQEAADDPFALDKERRSAEREDKRLQDLADKHADDPEMMRRIEAYAKSKGKDVPTPRPKEEPKGDKSSEPTAEPAAATPEGGAAPDAKAKPEGATADGKGGSTGGKGGAAPRPKAPDMPSPEAMAATAAAAAAAMSNREDRVGERAAERARARARAEAPASPQAPKADATTTPAPPEGPAPAAEGRTAKADQDLAQRMLHRVQEQAARGGHGPIKPGAGPNGPGATGP